MYVEEECAVVPGVEVKIVVELEEVELDEELTVDEELVVVVVSSHSPCFSSAEHVWVLSLMEIHLLG